MNVALRRPRRRSTATTPKRSRTRCMAIRSPCSDRTTHGAGRSCAPSCRARVAVEVLRRSDGARDRPARARATHGLFEGVVSERAPYLLRIAWPGAVQETEDPYSFGPLLGDIDLHLFNEGRHFELAKALGANVDDDRRRARRALRGLGAERRPRRGRRRLQCLGCAAPSDAAAPPRRRLGVVRAARRRGRALQVRHRRARAACRCRRRPIRWRSRPSCRRRPPRWWPRPQPFRWRDDEWMRGARRAPRAGRAALDLRGASRLVDAAAHDASARRCGTSRSTG